MLENSVVQYKGFRNLTDDDGKVTGFQVGVRQDVYRGSWLSQIRFGHLMVDDERFGPEDVTFLISGVEYTYDELATRDRLMWPRDEACYLRVKKDGGLATGVHQVQVDFWQIRSYLPPRLDDAAGHAAKSPLYNREMIIV